MKNLWKFVLFCLCFISLNGYSRPLIIGTESYAPPFEIREGKGEYFGFDIDIMNALCNEMKTQCRFTARHYKNFPSALASGEIDLAIAGIIIWQDRKEFFLFSFPYKVNYQTFVVLKTSNYKKIDDLEGKKVGVYRDSPDYIAANERLHGNVSIKNYFDFNEMIAALKDKKIDGLLVNASRASYWLSNQPELKTLEKPFQVGEGLGIAAKVGNTNLINQVNQALVNIEKNGVYLKIYRKYFN